MAVDPNIPSVPSTVPTDQVPWFTAVKGCIEILMGQGRNTDANRALRVSEYRAGITKIQESLPEYILAQSMDIPAPPTNLIITKGVWSHHLTWDNPTDEIVSHIEIWVATNSQDRSNAVIRGVVTVTENLRGEKGSFDFSGLDVADDLVYWIRSISYAGNHSIWEPPDDQGGYVVPGNETLDETINDIMDILKGSITEDQLYIDLSSRIDLIDFPATGLIDRVSTLAQSINTVQSKLGDNFSSVETVSKAINGIEASHTIKVQADSNGKLVMAGIGLIADSVTQQSEIMMMANQFQIVIPGATPGSVPTQPFIIKNIDGVDIVGISGNLVIDGKILGKYIEANSITAAHLSSTEIFTMKLAVGSGSTGFSNFTDGCPADADSTLANINNAILQAEVGGRTLIQGGFINTNLIKTDAIVIGDLSGASTVINNASNGATYGAGLINGTYNAYNTNRVNGTAASTVVSNAAAGATFTSTTWANTLIGKAKLDTTVISGGFINTSLIKTSAIVIGDLSGASTFTAYNTNRVNGTAASTVVNNASKGAAAATTVDGWKYLNTTYIDGGNIYTGSITAASGAIADLAVDTLQIANNAVTVPESVSYSTVVTGVNKTWRDVAYIVLYNTSNVTMHILGIFRARVGYPSGVETTGYRVLANGVILDDYGMITGGIENFPIFQFDDTIAPNSQKRFTVQWYSSHADVVMNYRSLIVWGVKR